MRNKFAPIGWCPHQPKTTLNCNMNIFHKRQGQVDVNFCYFYTDTICQFRHLLADDALKLEVIAPIGWCRHQPKITLNCNMNIFHKRQGQVDVNFCYFYTDTIYQFRHLLADDALKLEVIAPIGWCRHQPKITLNCNMNI